jgi:TonB family protein
VRSHLIRAIGSALAIGSIAACAEPPPPSAPVVVETVRPFGAPDSEVTSVPLSYLVPTKPEPPEPPREATHVDGPPAAGAIISGALSEPTVRGDGTKIYTYSRGMTRPVRVSGVDPVISPEARAHGVEGTALVKCTIEINGSLTGCRILKGVEFMDDAIVAAVSTWKMLPVLVDGKPVALSYTFNVRMLR